MSKTFEMSRRTAIGAAIMAPAVVQAEAKGKRKGKRPNFLFIFPDQHRFDWLGGNPNLPIRTPNLDAIAARGVRFAKCTSAAPVCGPSRACLASGREFDQCGVGGNFTNYPETQTTYYAKLRDAGYFVAACGKLDLSKPAFDNGLDGKTHMAEWGFNDMNNCGGKGDAVFNWEKHPAPHEPYMVFLAKKGLADIHAADIAKRGGGHAGGLEAYNKTEPTPLGDEEYCDNWIADVGLNMMKSFPSGKPWHLVINFTGPHDPEDITKRMESAVRSRNFPAPIDCTMGTPDVHNAIRQNYTAMVENLDRLVGLYVKELERRGELENTIIVFSSDHGDMLGDHNRWGKNLPYDASACVPLIVAGPGVKPQKTDTPVSVIDIGATFLDYAGAERPAGMTAKSMRPFLEGKTKTHREYVLSGLYNWRSVSDGRYKLVQGFDPKVKGNGASVPPGSPLPMVLFDYEQDPLEMKNYAAAEPAVVERLAKLLPERNPDPTFAFATKEQIAAYGGSLK
jgi:arylsulfatase A-like enzyme